MPGSSLPGSQYTCRSTHVYRRSLVWEGRQTRLRRIFAAAYLLDFGPHKTSLVPNPAMWGDWEIPVVPMPGWSLPCSPVYMMDTEEPR